MYISCIRVPERINYARYSTLKRAFVNRIIDLEPVFATEEAGDPRDCSRWTGIAYSTFFHFLVIRGGVGRQLCYSIGRYSTCSPAATATTTGDKSVHGGSDVFFKSLPNRVPATLAPNRTSHAPKPGNASRVKTRQTKSLRDQSREWCLGSRMFSVLLEETWLCLS